MSNIEKYEKIVKENNVEMVELWILYNMQCHENYENLKNEDDKAKLLYLTYSIWLKVEDISLEKLSDVIMDNYEEALNGEITKFNICIYL